MRTAMFGEHWDCRRFETNHVKKLWTWWLLTYAELNYWLVGTSPEGYHLAKAHAWSRIDDHARTIEQLRLALKYSNNLRVRCQLAWHLACLGDWTQAAQEYANVAAVTPLPVALFGQAEAEMHLGNKLKAVELLGTIDRKHPQFTERLKSVCDQLVEACLARE